MLRAVTAASLLLVFGCGAGQGDDESRILGHIERMSAAIEGGDIDDFMDPVAEDFLAGNGRIDRRALGLLARRERLARSSVRIRRLDTEVEIVAPGRATATFRALATGGSGLLPAEGQLWRVETGWRLDDDRWRLIAADWRPALD